MKTHALLRSLSVLLLIASAQLHAATFTVNSTSASGPGTLSQAFADANGAAGPDIIAFDSVVFATPQTITPSTELAVNGANGSITINGPGPHLLTVSGGSAHRVFYGGTSSDLTLTGMTLTGGTGTGSGAPGGGAVEVESGIAVGNSAALTLTNCIFRGNTTTVNGGVMRINGNVTVNVTNCLFISNTATGNGGVGQLNGSAGSGRTNSTFTNCAFIGNSAGNSAGGAMNMASFCNVTFNNCTFHGNSVNATAALTTGRGGAVAISFENTASMINCTVTGNSANGTAGGAGGGISGSLNISGNSAMTLQNTLVSGNTDTLGSANIYFGGAASGATVWSSNGGNLVADGTGAPAPFNTSGNPNGNNDRIGTSGSPIVPLLSPPGNHGGTGWTRALLSGSPGIDQGDNTPSTGLTTDGRGASRTVGGVADIGAYERQAAPADFTATSLPPGQVAVAYSYTLATGATGFTYTVTNGSLPSPLLLTNSAGTVTIAGTPAANGTSTFQITASDGTNSVVTQYQLVIGSGGAGPVAPTVSTDTQTNVTHNSATLGGNVTADGGASVTERGIVWSTNANPTTADTKVANGSGTGTFSGTVNGLPSNTPIHVRAYATNSVNTSYGSDISFTTLQAPVAITSLTRVGPATSNALVVTWLLTFASPVNTLNSTHFSLTGPAATGSSITSVTTGTAGLTWVIGVTIGSTDGLLTLQLANATGLTPSISNTLPFNGDSVTIDKTPPTVVSVTRLAPGGQNTNATTVTFRVTYSEPVNLTAPLTTHYQVVPVGGSTITGTVQSVTGADGTNTRDVQVQITGGTGEFRLRVLD